jgi:hypothetical protein
MRRDSQFDFPFRVFRLGGGLEALEAPATPLRKIPWRLCAFARTHISDQITQRRKDAKERRAASGERRAASGRASEVDLD